MKIAILGYGKMGQMIEQMAIKKGHEIITVMDPELKNHRSNHINLNQADVAVEFSNPESAVQNYLLCFEAGVPVVSGTTGWLKDWKFIMSQVEKYQACFFYASNFSLGVNLLFKINQQVAKMMSAFPDYELNILEAHHTAKKDAPSGTAITLANQLIEQNPAYDDWSLNTYGREKHLPIFSLREGKITGVHTVNYVSQTDKISIRHEAFGREGFAAGAIAAAEFVIGKNGIFTMEDLLDW